ncbi:MAG: ABC transporter permease [Deltaproteobacteria bacterium]|nr:ABC transporter permease [Deltaproteobacteria bacterium]
MNDRARESYWRVVWAQFRRHRLARFGFGVVVWLTLIATLAPFIANHKPLLLKWQGHWYCPIIQSVPNLPEHANFLAWRAYPPIGTTVVMPAIPYSPTGYDLDAILEAPSLTHWLGTDDQGRDVAARMVHGTRSSLSIGFIAVAIAGFIGIVLGAWAGYYGGIVDILLSRLIEVMYCFPTFFLILAVLAFVQPSIYNIMIVIGLTGWTGIARLVRGEFLKLKGQDFVAAVTVLGASHARVMFRHLLPNALAPVLVSLSFDVASAVLVESSLSFLGFGVPPYEPSWGGIISQSRDFLDIGWWLTLSPGFAIFLTITAFNLIGEGLRDATDPRLRG